jgi:hypothetical protein
VRVKELFVMRVRIIKILKSIHDREKILEQLKNIVNMLTDADDKLLDNQSSEQA